MRWRALNLTFRACRHLSCLGRGRQSTRRWMNFNGHRSPASSRRPYPHSTRQTSYQAIFQETGPFPEFFPGRKLRAIYLQFFVKIDFRRNFLNGWEYKRDIWFSGGWPEVTFIKDVFVIEDFARASSSGHPVYSSPLHMNGLYWQLKGNGKTMASFPPIASVKIDTNRI